MKCRIRNWLMVVISAVAWASAQAEVRIALIGSELSPSGEAALGLAEVSVSGRSDVELLDRTTISKTLREHGLLADGFAQAEDAVQLGKLLAVDVFVHVESIQEENALAVVAFETAQGIRLLDEVITGGDAGALAEGLAGAVDRALTKWGAPVGQSTAIALMSVRNVDLPRSRNAECDSIGALLERRLLGSPDVVVVERKRLQSLNRDHEITMERPEERLLSAPVLLELDVSQLGADGGLQATAFLSDANSAELGRVHAEGKALPALADQLCADILHFLKKGQASPPSDPALESARFFRMARFWKAQERPDLTSAAAESAYALDPGNPVMQALLINSLFTAANANMTEARPNALACAARGMAMLLWQSGKPDFSDPGQEKQFTQLKADNENFFRGYGESVGRSRQQNPFSAEESATYVEFCRDWLVQSPFSPDVQRAPSIWDLLLFVAEEDAFQYFPDNESAWRTLLRSIKRWINERMAKEHTAIPPWVLFQTLISVEDSLGVSPDYRIRSDLWSHFVGHGDSLLRWFGRCGRVFDEARQMDGEDRWATDKSRALLADIQAAIRDPVPGGDPEALCVAAWVSIRRNGGDIGRIDDRARLVIRQQLAEMVELTRAMLESGHLNDMVLNSVKSLLGAAERTKWTDLRAESLRLLEQAAAAAKALPASTRSPDVQERLATFHDWVREQIEPGSTAPPPSGNVNVESIDLGIPRAGWVGNAALLQDETGVFVLSAFCAPPRLFLQKWILGDKVLADLGMAEFPMPCPFGGGSRSGMGTSRSWVLGVDDVCLGSNLVVAALRKGGVILFDRTSPATEALQETTTLPVEHPLSVSLLGPILYVGTDDGYLVAYDTVGRTGSVLAASSRKEKKSPFDDGPPVRITAIFPDPPRQRIVFLASVVEAESDLGMAMSPQGGIWEYRPDTKQFRQLASYPHRADDIIWCEMVKEGGFIIRALWGGVFMYDLATDKLDILSQDGKNKMYGTAVKLMVAMGLDQVSPGTMPVMQRTTPLGPPYLVRGDWLWVADPSGRFSMKTYQFEKWLPFRMPDGSARQLRPDIGMVAISDTQTLFAMMHELWLVTMDGNP